MANTIANTVFELNVVSDGESEVIVPDTGSFTGTMENQNIMNQGASIAIIVAIIVAILSMVSSVVFHKLSRKTKNFQLKNKNFRFASMSSILVFLFSVGLLGKIMITEGHFTNAANKNVDVALISDSPITINKNKADELPTEVKVKVTLARPQQSGYTFGDYILYMSAEELKDEQGNTIGTMFAPELADNTWGYKIFENETNYRGIPYTKTGISSAAWNNNTEEVEISFYIKLSPDIADGKYTSIITFSAISNGQQVTPPVASYTITWNANGGSVSPTTTTKNVGEQLGTLPTPTREGYNFLGWFTAATGGIQISAATIVTGNVTYWAHWEEIITCYEALPITYMQDITDDIKENMCSEKQYQIKDKRDEETYSIMKLVDGKIWMLDNLRLGGTSSILLTPSDTNIASNYTLPASSLDHFNLTGFDFTEPSGYNVASINTDYKNTTATNLGTGSGKIGTYYNYCAASAGLECNNYSADPRSNYEISYDVCPRGWHMPSSENDFMNLYHEYGDYNSMKIALSIVYSGMIMDASDYELIPEDHPNYDRNLKGHYWTSSLYDANVAHQFLAGVSEDRLPAAAARVYGFSIRCVAK